MTDRINAYAKLLINIGINLEKGQELIISSPVDCAPFARLCAAAAYEAGCREVHMNWSDDAVTREKFLHADGSVFDTVEPWRSDFYNLLSERGAGFLAILAEDPESLAGVDVDRIRRSSIASGKALAPFRHREMSSIIPWCVASVPVTAWAKKVFPEKSVPEAMDALWGAILDSVRVYEGGDPVAEWKTHTANLQQRVTTLNEYNFKYLTYKNSLGTDLTVELPENHIWLGGRENTAAGRPFCANMPTEEIFTAPKLDGVNGVICSSKPLVVNGDIADKFCFTLEGGKIVKIEAQRGKALLETAISVDEGACRFGEVSLVPYDSPISNTGLLFYNTLFDENASCHFAFGEAYPCVKGGSEMSKAELKEAGLNDSIAHHDFMVGTPDLSITGVTHDGREVPVFINGNFAF